MSATTLCISKHTLFQISRLQAGQFQSVSVRRASATSQKKKHAQAPKPSSKVVMKTAVKPAGKPLQQKPQVKSKSTTSAKQIPSAQQPIATTTQAIVNAPTGATPSPQDIPEIAEHIVNGPSTTRPAPINTPERAPGQSFFPKYAFALGKSYVAFYKTGVKNIYANFKTARKLQARLKPNYSGDIGKAVADGAINRQEFQLLHRNRHDLKRVPVFALVLAICGEFTPIVVLAFSNVVPWTCRIPKQIDKSRKKLEQRRAISFTNLHPSDGMPERVEELGRKELLHMNWSLGLSSAAWDWVFPGQLPGLPTYFVRKAVQKRVEYLEKDDALILRAGGVREMDEEEVKMACVERGINVLGRESKDLIDELGVWLSRQKRTSVETLLMLEAGNKYPALDHYGG